jgi:hypothetical protein
MYIAKVPLHVLEGFVAFLQKRNIVPSKSFSKYNMDALSSSLSLDMSDTEMRNCLLELLSSNNINVIASMFLHYSGHEIILPSNMVHYIMEFVLNALDGDNILEVACIFENPNRCKICYEATNIDIVTSILQHIDLVSFFNSKDTKAEKILDKLIQDVPVIVERIISNPRSVSSSLLMNSRLNKDNQLLLFHLRRDNITSIRKALLTRVNGQDLILIGGERDPLYLEFMKSKHASVFKVILARRPSFRACSE